MEVPSKSFTSITDVRIQPDAPVDTTLMRDLRDNDIHANEILGDEILFGSFQQAHAHTGSDGTAPIGGTTGGLNIGYGFFEGVGDIIGPNITRFKPDVGLGLFIDKTSIHIKHINDDLNETTNIFNGGKSTAAGIIDLRMGGAKISGSGFGISGRRSEWLFLKNLSNFIKYDRYTGIASGNQSIDETSTISGTGIGFQPELVIIWRATSNVTSNVIIRTKGFAGSDAKTMSTTVGTILSTLIVSLDIDGFTVGTSNAVNQNNIQYAFLALTSLSGAEAIQIDSYDGDGDPERIITNSALFTPDWVLIINTDTSGTTFGPVWATIGLASSVTHVGTTNPILEITENGVIINNANEVNLLSDPVTKYDIIFFRSGNRPG